jgi:dihydrofolate synthase/folylpolyglutamate synthase
MTSSNVIFARFLALHPKKIDLSLSRMHRLLPRLGHPERQLPPVIHVAGTNGKGSTVAFMRAMLEAAGKRVHVYTSPHLVQFHERIRLGHAGGGRLVTEDELVAAFAHVEEVNRGEPATVFEITTAAALHLFAHHPADVLLLEVGLGGRVDATNVVERPLACVITPVSLDHVEFLGPTVGAIAAEKAGILKRGVPAITAPQVDAARDVIEYTAAKVGAGPLILGGQDFTFFEEHGRLVFQDGEALLDLPLPRLPGRHQHMNAATAIATLRTAFGSGFPIGAIEKGLQNVEWPARLQRLNGHVTRHLPKGAEVWLDGGHNEDGGKVLAAAMADIGERSEKPLVIIAGMLSTKDTAGFFAPFQGLAERVIAVGIANQEAARAPEDVARLATSVGLNAEAVPGLAHALKAVSDRISAVPPRVLLTGSLYFAGEVLAFDGYTAT